ncbi:hypothetical protein CLAFUR4_13128, partial [Fulvia fulva]
MWLIIGKYTINNATPIENIAIDTFAIIDGRVFQQPPPPPSHAPAESFNANSYHTTTKQRSTSISITSLSTMPPRRSSGVSTSSLTALATRTAVPSGGVYRYIKAPLPLFELRVQETVVQRYVKHRIQLVRDRVQD